MMMLSLLLTQFRILLIAVYKYTVAQGSQCSLPPNMNNLQNGVHKTNKIPNIILTAFLFVFMICTVTAQDGCNLPLPQNNLQPGVGKTGLFPNLQASPGGKCILDA